MKISKVGANSDLALPLVSIIIPCFNGANTIKRTIESVRAQTLNNLECIIIDDGSTDESKKVVLEVIKNDKRFRYIYQDNAGVANARNAGFYQSKGIYTCCLDKDDAIAPTFLKVCVEALEEDRSLGIAYTGLWYIKPDGEEGLSPWPGEWNYDDQLQGKNQIPTCNVARREVWERLGGQRQRYAPGGAGEEDAEMWLRAGAYGWKAQKVTDEGLFIYSWLSGQVSGSKNHAISDWRGMHPWIKDGRHPFASYATPKKHSHAVSQYDQPEISVIIPVGPGHEQAVINALDSLEMQHFRKWEAVVVLDTTLEVNELKRFKQAYPYVRLVESFDKNTVKDGRGFANRGAGAARNLGASIARAPFLFFLDADDVLNQPDALDKFLLGWQQEEAIIYSDYLGKSTWPLEAAQKEFGDRLLGYIERTGQVVVSYKAAEYDYQRAIAEPKYNPNNPKMPYYLWCTVSVLIPKAWHNAIGGFDESMSTWEDVDYFWRLARAGYCFYRVAEPLMLYNYDSGHRREASIPRDKTSRQNHQNMINYMISKYKKLEPKMCNCRGKRSAVTTPEAIITGVVKVVNGQYKDEDFVLIEFMPNYAGNRQLVGAATRIKYGYSRRAGDRFLVHKNDVAAQPHIFKPVPERIEPPKAEITPPEPPKPVQVLEAVEVSVPPKPVIESTRPKTMGNVGGRKRK